MAELITLARPYAKAAFEHAKEAKQLKEWSKMLYLAALIASDSDVQVLVKNPDVTHEQIATLFINVAGSAFDESFNNMIHLLVDNRRVMLLPEMAQLFEKYRAEADKTLDVDVISAFEMNNEEKDHLTAALEKRFSREIILHCRVDSSLIAGAIIRAGDKVIDGSARGRLHQLTERLVS